MDCIRMLYNNKEQVDVLSDEQTRKGKKCPIKIEDEHEKSIYQ